LSSGPWLFSRNLLLKEMAGGDEAAETADAAEATKANVREQAEQIPRIGAFTRLARPAACGGWRLQLYAGPR